MSRWARFTDFGTDDRPVRQKLLRRVAAGKICGFVSPVTNRPCMGTPAKPGRYCQRHDISGFAPEKIPSKPKPASVLCEVLGLALAPEERDTLNEIYEFGPICLDDQIAIVRLRLIQNERSFRDGYLTTDDYTKTLLRLTEELRKLVEVNSKLAVNEALARRFAVDETPQDAFDPLAEPTPDEKKLTDDSEVIEAQIVVDWELAGNE